MGLWKVLREPESRRRYCGTAISFVAFCLKVAALPTNKIPTRFADCQRTILHNYKTYLEADVPSSENDIERFQDTLYCILFRESGSKINADGRLACPVQTFIALLSLRKTGDFVKAGLVTQPISRLLYLSRSVVLRIALRGDDRDSDDFIR